MGQAKDLVERGWQIMEAHDFSGLTDMYGPDVEFTQPGVPPLRGPEQVRPLLEAFSSAFPDLQHEVRDYAEAGDTIALELRVSGTHTGTLRTPSGEIPPTGKKIVLESVDYITVAGGRITSWHTYFDQLTFLRQLGLLPQAALAGQVRRAHPM